MQNAASAVPASGRNITRDRAEILRERGLVANLYSLRGSFVERLCAQSVRIPLKLEGDDGLIGAFVRWDLNPAKMSLMMRVSLPAGRGVRICTPFANEPSGLENILEASGALWTQAL
jgi:hypothetical protein